MEKCSICNKEIYWVIGDAAFCAKHFVEHYNKDKRFLEDHLEKFLDHFSRGEEFTDEEKEFLKEVKIQFPDTAEEFPILFENLN